MDSLIHNGQEERVEDMDRIWSLFLQYFHLRAMAENCMGPMDLQLLPPAVTPDQNEFLIRAITLDEIEKIIKLDEYGF